MAVQGKQGTCVFRTAMCGPTPLRRTAPRRYNAPITAGNFIELCSKGFYDGMQVQRADGFVVQTGDPRGIEGADESKPVGYVKDGRLRKIPLEVFPQGASAPLYGSTFDEEGFGGAAATLPFQAYGCAAPRAIAACAPARAHRSAASIGGRARAAHSRRHGRHAPPRWRARARQRARHGARGVRCRLCVVAVVLASV